MRCQGRGCGVGRGLGEGVGRGVTLGVPVGVAVGLGVTVVVAVGVGLGVTDGVGVGVVTGAQYLPPVFKTFMRSSPPQTIISLKVQTAVSRSRAEGVLVVLVSVQLSVPGLYRPPVDKKKPRSLSPPQTIISLLVHTAV